MGSPVVSSDFTRLLDKRLREVTEDVTKRKSLESMIPTFYSILDSDGAVEEFFDVSDLGDIPVFNGKLEYLPVYPGFHVQIEPKEYAAGIQFGRKLIDDKKYGVFDKRAALLMKSAYRVREKVGVGPFANAFTSSYTFMKSEEGIALCGSHLNKTGASTTTGFDNSGSTALSKTAVAATRLLLKQFKTAQGERFEISNNIALVVPDNLADTADEIIGSRLDPDSANNTINPYYKRYQIIPYPLLDDYDTNNWFMVDMDAMKQNLVFIDRIKPEYQTSGDWDTYRLLQKVYMRIGMGWKDWRWIYGHSVT
jgi:hypothetical protein